MPKMNPGWKKRQLQLARNRAVVMRNNLPNKPPKPHTTKREFLNAISGTGGILKNIALNLGICRSTVKSLLARDDWDDMREMVQDERDSITDLAETELRALMVQNMDLMVKHQTVKWYLQKIARERFGDELKTGPAVNVNVLNQNANIVPVDALNLPIEIQRALLDAMDKRDAIMAQRELMESAAGSVPNSGIAAGAIVRR